MRTGLEEEEGEEKPTERAGLGECVRVRAGTAGEEGVRGCVAGTCLAGEREAARAGIGMSAVGRRDGEEGEED